MKNFTSIRLQANWLAAILITTVIVWLHFVFWLHVGGLWRDEVNSINVAGSNSLRGLSEDSFPALMPLLLHYWVALGLDKSDLELRVFGLLVGLGILAALWFSSWKINHSPPLLTLTLFGINATLIVFGDSIRAYGLGSLLIILTVTSACLFLKQPSRHRAVWFALFSVLSVQALYHNAVLVGAIGVGAMSVCARRRDWRAFTQVFIAGSLAAISLLPYAPILISARDNSAVLRTGMTLPELYGKFVESLGFPFEKYIYIWEFFALLTLLCAVAAFVRIVKPTANSAGHTITDDLCLFAGITLPVALVAFSCFLAYAALSVQSWYLLPLMALAVVCFDICLDCRKKFLGLALLVFALINTLVSTPVAHAQINYRFTNMDIRVRQLTPHVSAGDYIIVLPWFCGISFEHYYKGPIRWTTVPPVADHMTHRYDLVKTQLQNTNAIEPIFNQISQTLQSGHQVFVLASWGWFDIPDPKAIPPPSLPPAPQKSSGWSEMPYTEVWASQIKHFLANHGRQFVEVKNPTEGMLLAEQMQLFMIDGWKTNSP